MYLIISGFDRNSKVRPIVFYLRKIENLTPILQTQMYKEQDDNPNCEITVTIP